MSHRNDKSIYAEITEYEKKQNATVENPSVLSEIEIVTEITEEVITDESFDSDGHCDADDEIIIHPKFNQSPCIGIVRKRVPSNGSYRTFININSTTTTPNTAQISTDPTHEPKFMVPKIAQINTDSPHELTLMVPNIAQIDTVPYEDISVGESKLPVDVVTTGDLAEEPITTDVLLAD